MITRVVPPQPDYAFPDLTDPCTLGGVLHLVREAWGDPTICSIHKDGVWYVHSATVDLAWHQTEAEALVAALEAAPARGTT
jgi:hypothetical protein